MARLEDIYMKKPPTTSNIDIICERIKKYDERLLPMMIEIDLLLCSHANGDIDDKSLYAAFDKLKKKYTEPEPPKGD